MKSLASLFDTPLLFFSGKGGVGKTTVGLACALSAAKRGKKVLLALLNPTPWVAELFRVERFSYTPTTAAPNLDIMEIDPKHALQEYLSVHMHLGKLAEKAANTTLVTHFLDAVPGLNELLVLGKIYSLASDHFMQKSVKPAYDLIIVDAPATGHGLSLLQVPLVVQRAITSGPLKTQTDKIIGLLSDKAICRLCLVTLAEDMPVQETIDFSKTVGSSLYMTLGPVFLNAVLEALPVFKSKIPSHASFNALRLYEERLAIQHHYKTQLQNEFDTLLSLPFVASETMGIAELNRLAQEMPA